MIQIIYNRKQPNAFSLSWFFFFFFVNNKKVYIYIITELFPFGFLFRQGPNFFIYIFL